MILDDPALALDPIMRKEFNKNLVAHLQESKSTLIYSSHLLSEVEAVADKIAILHGGRIVKFSDVEKLSVLKSRELHQFQIKVGEVRSLTGKSFVSKSSQ